MQILFTIKLIYLFRHSTVILSGYICCIRNVGSSQLWVDWTVRLNSNRIHVVRDRLGSNHATFKVGSALASIF